MRKPKAQIILDVLSSILANADAVPQLAGAVLKPLGGNCAVLPKIYTGDFVPSLKRREPKKL